jgi:YegS/Rv2252/BmrU family lipid kinase
MSGGELAIIVNPTSGARADPAVGQRRIAIMRAALERRGLHATIDVTERAGHARELAAASVARGARTLIVWGGDGTVNEAAAPLIGTPSALGLVPAGSGNGLAAALGVPRDPETAIAVALDTPPRRIDVGLLNERPFFNVAGVGLDAHIARLFNEVKGTVRGRWPYVSLGFTECCRYRAHEYVLRLDEEVRTTRALLIVFANGREFGMGARIAPQALLDDGVLDATVIEERSTLARFWHARHLAFGTIARAPRVTVRPVRTASIERDGPIEYHVDGEHGVAERQIAIRILPGALLVKAPVRPT